MKVQIKALDGFSHGALLAAPGGEYTMNKGDADDLVKIGLAEILPAAEEAPTGVTDSKPAEDDLADLVGGEKMDDAPLNKMEPAPANKGKKK